MNTQLQALAEQLGLSRDVLWDSLVTHQKTEGWIALIDAAILLLLSLVAMKALKKYFPKDKDKIWRETVGYTYIVIAVGVSIAVFFILHTTIQGGVGKVCNPEYYAWKEILKSFK